jgi:hypothetical protein
MLFCRPTEPTKSEPEWPTNGFFQALATPEDWQTNRRLT